MKKDTCYNTGFDTIQPQSSNYNDRKHCCDDGKGTSKRFNGKYGRGKGGKHVNTMQSKESNSEKKSNDHKSNNKNKKNNDNGNKTSEKERQNEIHLTKHEPRLRRNYIIQIRTNMNEWMRLMIRLAFDTPITTV